MFGLVFLSLSSLHVQFLCSQLDGVRGGKLSLNSLSKLLVVNFSISVQIQPPKNGHNFLLTGQVSHRPQESFQVLFIDVLVIPVVNGLEGSSHAEVVAGFQGSLDVFCFEVQLDLFEDELTHGSLYTHRQELVWVQLLIGSLGGS